MLATIIIFTTIIIIGVIDILLGFYKKKYITDIFREWYKSKPFAPYAVGVLCIGHFQSLVEVSSIPFFIGFSVLFLAYCLIMGYTKVKWSRKFFIANQKYFFIPMAIGSIIGAFWRT